LFLTTLSRIESNSITWVILKKSMSLSQEAVPLDVSLLEDLHMQTPT